MSSDARFSVPTGTDGGKVYTYNAGTDRYDLTASPSFTNLGVSGTVAAGNATGLVRSGTSAPGWADILGQLDVRQSGATAPTLSAFRGGQVQEYSFDSTDRAYFTYHIPHDYKPGTDIYIHAHWSHNGTSISGNMEFTWYATYAKGFAQGAASIFGAEITLTQTITGLTNGNTPRYVHRVDEIQLSTPGGSASQLDTDLIEVDGIISVCMSTSAIPTITGGSPNNPFVLQADIHYRTTGLLGTPQRSPDFYA